MPVMRALTVALPPGGAVDKGWRAFGDPVTISGIKDQIDVMHSLQKPKKARRVWGAPVQAVFVLLSVGGREGVCERRVRPRLSPPPPPLQDGLRKDNRTITHPPPHTHPSPPTSRTTCARTTARWRLPG